jgi:hypothetical protein
MILRAFTLRASWLGQMHPLYAGNALVKAIVASGWVDPDWSVLPCGGVRVVRR